MKDWLVLADSSRAENCVKSGMFRKVSRIYRDCSSVPWGLGLPGSVKRHCAVSCPQAQPGWPGAPLPLRSCSTASGLGADLCSSRGGVPMGCGYHLIVLGSERNSSVAVALPGVQGAEQRDS